MKGHAAFKKSVVVLAAMDMCLMPALQAASAKEHGFTIVFSRSCRAHVLAICSETSLFSVTCTPARLGGLRSGVVRCGVRSVEVLNSM